jgi:sugar lactone lactonase YvrE
MNSIPSSTCSTIRAAAIPFVFRNLPERNYLPAWCGVLVLMLGGAWVGVQAQTGNFGTVNVGSTSPTPISMIFTFDTAETPGSISVVTQGATGRDFADAGTGTCKAGTAYTAGETCTVGVSFTPKFAGTRYGAAKLLDGSGNVLANGYLQGTGVGPQVIFLPGIQSVVANSAKNGLGFSEAVAVDGSGNVYIADDGNWQVLKETLSAAGYTQSVVADAANNGLVGPLWVAVDGSGNLYIAEQGNSRVVKETLSAGGYIQSVVADSATNGLSGPLAVAVDGSGNVYISDWNMKTGSNRVLKETLSAGGYSQSVVVYDPEFNTEVAVDGSGNVYISDWNIDSGFSRVLKETVSADGYTQSVVADSAINGLLRPIGVAVDGSGNVYIVDFGNSRVLKETLSAGGYTQSVVANAANNGLVDPSGVAVDGSGNVYITDSLNYRVLKEDLADPPSLTFASTAVGATSSDSPRTATVSNDGNATLIFPLPATGENPSVPANFDWDPSSSCELTTASSSAAFELAAGASCTMAFDFKPTPTGSINGIAELTDNNLNVTGAVQRIQLTGLQGSQTITFPPPESPLYYGVDPITLSATGGASGNPVRFSIVSGPGSLSGTNNSVLKVTGTGAIVIAADQAGDTDYAAAQQVTRSITVLLSATLTSPAPNSTLTGSSVTFAWLVGTGVTEYYLFLGSNGVGSNNLYSSGYTSHKSVNVTGLPVNGETVYARLYSFIGGAWHYLDYTYRAESLATLTSPAPNSKLTGSSITFNWSGGDGIMLYYLFLGSTGVGSSNIYSSGYTTHDSVNVTGLPQNGETVYARLYWYVDEAWHYFDYTYTAE